MTGPLEDVAYDAMMLLRGYAEHHYGKTPPDIEKGMRNRVMAMRIEQALAGKAAADAAAPAKPLTAADLAEALDCFWNAAIGAFRAAAYNSGSHKDVVTAMVEGVAAVSARLKDAPPVS